MFRVNTKCSDGLDSWCKQCHNKAKEDWIKRHPEAAREKYRRQHLNRMKRLHGEDYVVGLLENRKGGKASSLTDEERRIRHNVRRTTRRAIKSGKLFKQPCWCCGDEESEAHHPDYSAPLDVVWLCKKHHREVHS
jgi:hypothetical protein